MSSGSSSESTANFLGSYLEAVEEFPGKFDFLTDFCSAINFKVEK